MSKQFLEDSAVILFALTIAIEIILGVTVIISCFVALGEGITWQFHPTLDALFAVASINGALQLVMTVLACAKVVPERKFRESRYHFFRLIGTATIFSLSIASMVYIPDMETQDECNVDCDSKIAQSFVTWIYVLTSLILINSSIAPVFGLIALISLAVVDCKERKERRERDPEYQRQQKAK